MLKAPYFVCQKLQGFHSGLRTRAGDPQFLYGFVTRSLPFLSFVLLNGWITGTEGVLYIHRWL